MAVRKIPQNTIAKQVNIGDQFGDLWATYNVGLTENPGKIVVSPKLTVSYSSDSDASFVTPFAFVRNMSSTPSIDTYFAICENAVFYTTYDNGAAFFRKDTKTNSPTTTLSSLYSDAINLNGTLAITTSVTTVDIATLSGGTWVTNWGNSVLGRALVASIPHPLCLGFNNLLLVGDQVASSGGSSETSGAAIGQASVHSINAANTGTKNKLIFPAEYEVMWIRSSNTSVWIGCRHKFGGEGKVFQWDGATEGFTNDYKIGAPIPYACVIKDEIPHVINSNGELLKFNGGGFSVVAQLPIANHKVKRWDNDGSVPPSTGWNVHRNGMTLVGNKINILLAAGVNGNNYQFLENFLSGIWEYTEETGLYHKNAIVKGNDAAVRDYGSPVLTIPGALYEVGKLKGTFFAGAKLLKDHSSTPISVLNTLPSTDVTDKMGYFITPRLYGDQIEEVWQKIFLNYRTLTTSGNFIALKYRTSVSYVDTFDQVGTWASTTSFTTTASEMANVAVGDEIEILSGEGSGQSATITNITGTYTVTLDTTLTSASGTFRFRKANWTKIDSITDLVTAHKEFGIGINSNWVQFKILMFASGGGDTPEIEKLTIVSDQQIKAT